MVMNSPTTERLFTLRVEDLMNSDLVTIQEYETMCTAARKLRENHINGAPVVDQDGKCVGVVTSSDFVAWEGGRCDSHVSTHSADEPWTVERQNDDLVSSHMSRNVQTIPKQCMLLTAAARLCEYGIHRLVVVDDDHRPVGMISSLDFVAAIVGIGEDYYGFSR